MEEKQIRNLDEFRRWVKMQLAGREISQSELARQMEIPKARISEATHGKQPGRKYVVPIIVELGGNIENFKEFLKTI